MQKFVIGNWKMQLGIKQSVKRANILAKYYNSDSWLGRLIKRENKVEAVVCPSFPCILETARILQKSPIKIGAQDMFWLDSGAYTGEVSAKTLIEAGCDYVILGHSERRSFLEESDEMVNKKARMALSENLAPIICIGETWDERRDNEKEYVIRSQITNCLRGIDIRSDRLILLAYEPIWSIGTGETADPTEAVKISLFIREVLMQIYEREIVENNIKILYGGSVDSLNVASFTRSDLIDGVLVGGASLNMAEFLKIVEEVKKN